MADGSTVRWLTGHASLGVAVLAGPGPDRVRVVVDNGAGVEVWDTATLDRVARHDVGFEVTSLTAVRHDGRDVVAVGGDATVAVWELPGRQRFRVHDDEEGTVMVVLADVARAGRPILVSGGFGEVVRVRDLDTGERLTAADLAHAADPRAVAGPAVTGAVVTSVSGRAVLATCGGDELIRLWDLDTYEPVAVFDDGHDGWIWDLAVLPWGPVAALASSGDDGTICCHALDTGALLGDPLVGHGTTVKPLVAGRVQGRPVLISGGFDGTVRLWEPSGHTVVADLGEQVLGLAFFEGGIAAATGGGTALIDLTDQRG